MKKFEALRSNFILVETQHIDTDQIIPARFLKQTDKEGLADALFYDWRHDEDGKLDREQIFNRRADHAVKILVAGRNFGCGSSREHAVWALAAYGFAAILSPSIGDIFKTNALKNGLLPIEISEEFFEDLKKNADADLTIDLEYQYVDLKNQARFPFAIDRFAKLCLMQGTDQLGYILKKSAAIESYERRDFV